MSLKKVIFLFVFFSFIIPVSAIQQTSNSSTQAAGSQAAAASAAENAQIRQLANARANDAQALRDDIRKMRALVGQMETNLAFVDNTQSAAEAPVPARHRHVERCDQPDGAADHIQIRAELMLAGKSVSRPGARLVINKSTCVGGTVEVFAPEWRIST